MQHLSKTTSTQEEVYNLFCVELINIFKEKFNDDYQDMLEYCFNYIETDLEQAFFESINNKSNFNCTNSKDLALWWFNYHISEIRSVYGFCS